MLDMSEKALEIIEHTPEVTTIEMAVELLPEGLLKAYNKIPEEFHAMDDSQLENVVRPTQAERILRIKFWKEVERAKKENQLSIKPINVYDKVCSKTYFYEVLKQSDKSAYLFRPPYSYGDRAEELIEYGINRLRNEVMTARLVFEDSGHIDSKGAKVVLELIQYLDARTKGAITQKHQVESKSMHMQVNVNEKDANKPFDLQDEIKKLRAQIDQAKGTALVEGLPSRMTIDITAEEKEALFETNQKD